MQFINLYQFEILPTLDSASTVTSIVLTNPQSAPLSLLTNNDGLPGGPMSSSSANPALCSLSLGSFTTAPSTVSTVVATSVLGEFYVIASGLGSGSFLFTASCSMTLLSSSGSAVNYAAVISGGRANGLEEPGGDVTYAAGLLVVLGSTQPLPQNETYNVTFSCSVPNGSGATFNLYPRLFSVVSSGRSQLTTQSAVAALPTDYGTIPLPG